MVYDASCLQRCSDIWALSLSLLAANFKDCWRPLQIILIQIDPQNVGLHLRSKWFDTQIAQQQNIELIQLYFVNFYRNFYFTKHAKSLYLNPFLAESFSLQKGCKCLWISLAINNCIALAQILHWLSVKCKTVVNVSYVTRSY